MSEAENTAPVEWEAVLSMGLTYTFGGVKYEKGVGKPVDEATKLLLEERAIDHKVVADEYDDEGTAVTEPRQKFKFRKIGGDADKGEKEAPRQRTRATR